MDINTYRATPPQPVAASWFENKTQQIEQSIAERPQWMNDTARYNGFASHADSETSPLAKLSLLAVKESKPATPPRIFTREEIVSFITPGDNGIIATLARQLLAAMEEDERLVTVGTPTEGSQP